MSRFAWVGVFAGSLISCGGEPHTPSTVAPDWWPLVVVRPEFESEVRGILPIQEMALSQDYVNFTVPFSGVYRVPKYGGEMVTIETDPNGSFDGVAATSGNTIVWTHTGFSDDGIPLPTKVMRQTGREVPVTLAELSVEDHLGLPGLQIVGSTVYMAVQLAGGAYGVYAVPLEGGDARFVAELPGNRSTPPDWVVAESHVYYLPVDPRTDCALRRVSVSGGAPEDLAPCPSADTRWPLWIAALDDTDVFLAWRGEFWKVPRQGGAAAPLFSASDPEALISIRSAVVDAQNLYFQLGPPGIGVKLVSIPKSGGAVTTNNGYPFVYGVKQILQDENNLFLLDGLIVTVSKVPLAR